MIVKGKDVIGLKVVTVDTGKVIETVDDIAFNPTTQRVEALLVSSGGIFSSAKAIHMDDVRNIGEDAVVVPDASVIKSVKDLGDSVHSISDSNKHLVKTNVLTIDGKELGKVTDMYFDSATGIVDSMEVSQGGLKTITEGKKSIKPADIVTIGADATIVSAYTELKLEAQGEEGGLKGAVNDLKAKATDAAETVKDKSIELKDGAVEKAVDAKGAIDDKRAEAEVKANQLANDIQVKAGELQTAAQEHAAEAMRQVDDIAAAAKTEADALTDRSVTAARSAHQRTQEVIKESKHQVKDAAGTITVNETKVTKKS